MAHPKRVTSTDRTDRQSRAAATSPSERKERARIAGEREAKEIAAMFAQIDRNLDISERRTQRLVDRL